MQFSKEPKATAERSVWLSVALETDSQRGCSLSSFSTHSKVIIAQLQQSHHKQTCMEQTEEEKNTTGEVVTCCTVVFRSIYEELRGNECI